MCGRSDHKTFQNPMTCCSPSEQDCKCCGPALHALHGKVQADGCRVVPDCSRADVLGPGPEQRGSTGLAMALACHTHYNYMAAAKARYTACKKKPNAMFSLSLSTGIGFVKGCPRLLMLYMVSHRVESCFEICRGAARAQSRSKTILKELRIALPLQAMPKKLQASQFWGHPGTS